jgi:hypothetical protein
MALELIDLWKMFTEKGYDVQKDKQYMVVHYEEMSNVINCGYRSKICHSRENSEIFFQILISDRKSFSYMPTVFEGERQVSYLNRTSGEIYALYFKLCILDNRCWTEIGIG